MIPVPGDHDETTKQGFQDMNLDPMLILYALPMADVWIVYFGLRKKAEWRSISKREEATEAGLLEPPTLHPEIDPALCIGSGACVRACPEGEILGLINGTAVLVAPSDRIGHGACRAVCPSDAIRLVFGTEQRGVDIPHAGADFQTNMPGVFIAGDLGNPVASGCCRKPTSRRSGPAIWSSLKTANARRSGTTRRLSVRAVFGRHRFSRASGSRSRPNMAPPSSARMILMSGLLVHAIASGFGSARAQETRDEAVDRAFDSALRTGQYDQAAAVLAKMANSGNAEAQYQLASLYRSGRGVALDEALAFKWMKAAAERGHVKAQFNLGSMYLAGRGVGRDAEQARIWLSKAKAQGYRDADLLLSNLTTRQSKESQTSLPAAPVAKDAPNGRPMQKTTTENGRPLILDAALRGQADAIRQLIASGADMASRDDEGNTAVALAAAAGQVSALNVLLSAGADADAKNKAGETPLMLAAAKGHSDIVERLLEKRADSTATAPGGASVLSMAVRGCQEPIIRALIKHGADARLLLDGDVSLLMLAATTCNERVVRLLLAEGIPVNVADQRGHTALWLAASRGDPGIVSALLSSAADPSIGDRDGALPLHVALESGRAEAATILLSRDKNIERRTPTGNTPLILAAQAGLNGIVQDLLRRGAMRDAKNNQGYTALMIATRAGHVEVVTTLINAGADRNLRNKKRETASDIAAALGHATIAQMLK